MSADVVPSLRVLEPGLCSSVQDLGRAGYGALGVAVGGAADVLSLRVANRLVGNRDDEAALEVTLTGGRYRLERPVRLALAGAPFPWTATAPGSAARALARWAAHDLEAGTELHLAATPRGARAYLACAGGLACESILGSRSTHLAGGFGGLGGRTLKAHDVVGLAGAGPRGAPRRLTREAAAEIEGWLTAPSVRVSDGAHTERFTPSERAAFLAGAFVVSARSDRMGVRLVGPAPRPPAAGRLLTEALPVGSVEVPSAGNAIVLLAEAPPTGGYPVIACLASVDLPRAGQWRPGESVRFEHVSLESARAAYRERARRLDALVPPETP